MSKSLTPEQRAQRIEGIVKIAGFVALLLVLGPLYLTLLHGMAALAALLLCGALGFVAINFIPALARLVGVWRLKALKAIAAANPIEILEQRYQEREQALLGIRANITESYAILQGLWSQIQEHADNFPDRPSQYLEKYNKLKALVELRGKKYKKAQANLVTFGQFIEEKRSDWKIAQTMAKASQLAQVGEDFQSRLMQDTALTTIQDGLNMAFSELETSLLDEGAGPETDAPKKQLTAGPPNLDLAAEFEPVEAEEVPTRATTRRHR